MKFITGFASSLFGEAIYYASRLADTTHMRPEAYPGAV
jgi:hypothetical protein